MLCRHQANQYCGRAEILEIQSTPDASRSIGKEEVHRWVRVNFRILMSAVSSLQQFEDHTREDTLAKQRWARREA